MVSCDEAITMIVFMVAVLFITVWWIIRRRRNRLGSLHPHLRQVAACLCPLGNENNDDEKRDRASPDASERVCEDTVEELLLRLPTKSVVRFQSVCKQWLSVATKRRFQLAHSRRHRDDGATATATFCWRLGPLDCCNIRDCRNGIIVVRRPSLRRVSSFEYFVSNLATGESKPIPAPPPADRKVHVRLKLDFARAESPHYRVVSVGVGPGIVDSLRPVVSIYSSWTGSWKQVDTSRLMAMPTNEQRELVYGNGVLSWWPVDRNGVPNWVASFDVDVGWARYTPPHPSMPAHWIGNRWHYFGEYGGRLHVIFSRDGHDRRQSILEVMEMNESYAGWSSKYRVDLRFLPSLCPESSICLVRGRRGEDGLLLNTEGSRVLLFYDMRSEKARAAADVARIVSQPQPGTAMVYGRHVMIVIEEHYACDSSSSSSGRQLFAWSIVVQTVPTLSPL